MQQQAPGTRGTNMAAKSILAVVLATTLMAPVSAFADTASAEKQAEAQAALASVNALQSELDEATAQYEQVSYEKAEAEANRDAAQERLGEVNSQIAGLQDRLGSRANSMYRSGNSSFLDLLLGATSFTQFATNWDMLNTINESDAELVQQAKDLRAQAQQEEATFAEQERVASEKADEAVLIKEEALKAVNTMQATYDNLSAEAAELIAQDKAAREAAEAAAAQSVVEQAVQQAAADNGGAGNSGNTNAPSYDAVMGSNAVERAMNYIGKADYDMGACSPGLFDCSGFVAYCLTGSYSRMGSTITFMNWRHVDDPQPGDVAVNASHCGIYIGGGQMIHAAEVGVGVIQGPVQSGMIFVRY